MINLITTNVSLIIQMFVQWAEVFQSKTSEPTQLGPGAVLYILIAAPLIVFASYELVTILTNLFRMRSSDRAPLMSHADGLMREGQRIAWSRAGASRGQRREFTMQDMQRRIQQERHMIPDFSLGRSVGRDVAMFKRISDRRKKEEENKNRSMKWITNSDGTVTGVPQYPGEGKAFKEGARWVVGKIREAQFNKNKGEALEKAWKEEQGKDAVPSDDEISLPDPPPEEDDQ